MAKKPTDRTRPRLIDELRARLEGPLQKLMNQNESILRLLGPLNALAAQRDLTRSGDFVRGGALHELDRESFPERKAATNEGVGRRDRSAKGRSELIERSPGNNSRSFEFDSAPSRLVESLTLRLEAFERLVSLRRSMESGGVSNSRANKANKEPTTRNRKRDSRSQRINRRSTSNHEWPETSPELLRMTREILSRHDALDRRLDRDLPAEARYSS